MMDLAILSTAAVSAAMSYVPKVMDGATEKIGEGAVEAAGKLIGWLRTKLSLASNEVLNEFSKHPDDPMTQEALKIQIQNLLRDNPQFADELQSLLPPAVEPAIVQTQTVSGEGAKAAQIAGKNNSVKIG